MPIPQSVRDLIATAPFAHLVTINPDSTLQVSVVWIGIDGDEFVFAHLGPKRKLRNIARDPRVAISLLDPRPSDPGLPRYLVIHGTGKITEDDASGLLQNLAHAYIGPEAVFPPPEARSLAGRILRVTPERYSGVGPWA